MNDHSWLLILGGVAVALAPFVLIGIGIASDYRTVHPKRPYEPHNARNIVLGCVVAIVASAMFGWLSHPSQVPTLGPMRTDSANGVPFVPLPTSVAAAPPAASAGAPSATSPRSTTTPTTTTKFAVHGSGLMTAFVGPLVKGTTLVTAATVPPGTVAVTTTKPPTTTATTKSTGATTTTTRGATTTTSTTRPRSTTTTVPATTTTATTVPVTTTTATTVPVTTTTATTVPVTTTTATTVPVTTTTGPP
jgi:hypothetical protein